MPDAFDDLTLDEIYIAIAGYQERERKSLISRVSAVMRGLSAGFGKKHTDPFKGLLKPDEISQSPKNERHLKAVFGGGIDNGRGLADTLKAAKERWLWSE